VDDFAFNAPHTPALADSRRLQIMGLAAMSQKRTSSRRGRRSRPGRA